MSTLLTKRDNFPGRRGAGESMLSQCYESVQDEDWEETLTRLPKADFGHRQTGMFSGTSPTEANGNLPWRTLQSLRQDKEVSIFWMYCQQKISNNLQLSVTWKRKPRNTIHKCVKFKPGLYGSTLTLTALQWPLLLFLLSNCAVATVVDYISKSTHVQIFVKSALPAVSGSISDTGQPKFSNSDTTYVF